MTKPSKVLILGLALPAFLLCAGCAMLTSRPVPGRVHHVVVCWLKEPGNAEARRMIIDVSRTFHRIPGVRDVRVGPALPSERTLVDDSFDVAVVMTFDDRETLDEYIVHPHHTEAVKNIIRPLVDRIIVYDIVESP